MRLFFAIEPDPPARAVLATLATSTARATGGRAVRAANLHLTLVFLGEVDAQRVDALHEAARRVAAGAAAFDLAFDVPGRFAGARVAWIAPSVPAPALLALQSALREACAQAGFAPDARRYAPHVTLARKLPAAVARGEPAPLDGGGPAEAVAWRATAMVLMRSDSTARGVEYRVLERYPLAGGRIVA